MVTERTGRFPLRWLLIAVMGVAGTVFSQVASAATYHVNQTAAAAADSNPGTESSQNTWVVHNTVVGNESGIVCMPRGDDWPLENIRVLNNLLIRNYVTADTVARGCDLTIFMGCPEYGPYERTEKSNHADYNVYANTGWTPTLRHSWNPDNTLAEWQQRFGEDEHSAQVPVEYELTGMRFELKSQPKFEKLAPLPEEIRSQLPPFTSVGCRRPGKDLPRSGYIPEPRVAHTAQP